MKSELSCFIRYNLSFINLISTFKFLYKRVKKYINKKINIKYYPDNYQHLLDHDFIITPEQNLENYIPKELTNDIELKLSSQTIKLNKLDEILCIGNSDQTKFHDIEDYESLHRFIWSRYYASDITDSKDIENIQALIDYWCHSFCLKSKQLSHNLITHPYTMSERMTNIIWFHIINKKIMSTETDYMMHLTAKNIINNLEFYHDGFGNHLINNIRSVLIYGLYFNNEKIIKNFSGLLDEYVNKFIISGFTKDYSSHYQLLFYYWLNDILKLSIHYNKTLLISILNKHLKELKEKTLFFYNSSSNTFDLVGDLSPDYPVGYLLTSLDENYIYDEKYSVQHFYKQL